jgi:ribosomal protein S18 acetylase RimI-like enzyme
MDVAIREPRTPDEWSRYYDLRWRILRKPWTDDKESARDEHESGAIHLMAWAGETLVGVGRLHFSGPAEAQVRYMAVEAEYAGRGVGSTILDTLEERARQSGARRIVLNARETAVAFYRKHGYTLVDKSGTLFGSIEHWSMSKEI